MKIIFNVAMAFCALGLCAQYAYADDVKNPCDLTRAQFDKGYMRELNKELFNQFDTEGGSSETDVTPSDKSITPPPAGGDGVHNESEWNAMRNHLITLHPWMADVAAFTWENANVDGSVTIAHAKEIRNNDDNITAAFAAFRKAHGCDTTHTGGNAVGGGTVGGSAGGELNK